VDLPADGEVDTAAAAPDEGVWPGLVTVVIPVRNGAGTIEAQLSALSEQNYTGAWELLVSDNGSTDGTQAMVEGWRSKFEELRLIDSSAVTGVSHARNAAVEAARGRFVAVCDADDVVTSSWLRELVAQSAPGAIIGGSFDEEALNDPVVLSWIHWSGRGSDGGMHPHLGFLPFARGSNIGVDKAVWSALGGWSESLLMGEDVDFSWRAQLAGVELRPAPEAIVHYRFRTDIRSTMRQAFKVGKSDAVLYATFREHGISPPSLTRVLRTYLGLAARLPQALVSPAWRGRCCRGLAYRAGRLSGSLRQRVWYP